MDNPSIISHISLGTNDFERAKQFYDVLMPLIGAEPLMHVPSAVAYGKAFPEFWLQTPIDGKPATVGNGTHVSFTAASPEEVDAFFRAAIAAGAVSDGEPGARPEYSDAYYGCFIRDLDGHKIKAAFWDTAKADPAHAH